ncbi:HET-domain-containing protein [Xylariomycetidae sp. FL0641]|nr:HET-domain-containing protein [Xylariomycetidae sp. FL0641]
MRLINVKTLHLEEFFGPSFPPYAILSHAWGAEEVTFLEWLRLDAAVKAKAGYSKIVGACRQAQKDGLPYLWCDTNCIDKRSSAELSEAINSMFAWYRDSRVCYAYLVDVDAKKTGQFERSRWWSRGWTLQELLAPSTVVFFDGNWRLIGDRASLSDTISKITLIHVGVLRDRATIYDYSIAQRMSWAADRQTTRAEDQAYCLLGIFDINMPLLYGEGHKAFIRLQQEIVKVSDDQSVLAWNPDPMESSGWMSVLAPSPTEFRSCGSVVRDRMLLRYPYSITNLGISMNLPMMKTIERGICLVGLNCARELQGKDESHSRTRGKVIPRRFQIWVILRLHGASYLRGLGHVFLQDAYPVFGNSTLKNLYLSLDVPRGVPGVEQENFGHPKALRHHGLIPAQCGFLVLVSSGSMNIQDNMFEPAYTLGPFALTPLCPRGVSTQSHLLVSSGTLTTLLSVFWDERGNPQEFLHTTIADPGMQTTGHMATQDEHDTSNSMHHLHARLRQSHSKAMIPYAKEKTDPLVWKEARALHDLRGNPEVAVNVVFREPPKL